MRRLSHSASLYAKHIKNYRCYQQKEKTGKQELIHFDFSMLRKIFNSMKNSLLLVKMSSDSNGIELVFSDWYKETSVWKSNAIRTTSSSSLSDIKVVKIYSYTWKQITTLRHWSYTAPLIYIIHYMRHEYITWPKISSTIFVDTSSTCSFTISQWHKGISVS